MMHGIKAERIAYFLIRGSFLLLFILVPLILTPWNYELFEYNKMMVTYGLTIIIMGAWAVKMISRKEIQIAKTPLDIPIALFFLSQLLSTLFSMDPHVSWFGYYSRFNGGLVSTITYILLYYAFISNFSIQRNSNLKSEILNKFENLNNSKNQSKKINQNSILNLLYVILGTAVVVGLYGIAQHFGIDKNVWVQDVQSRVFSTLGQPNWLAAYLVALIPLTWGMSLHKLDNRMWKVGEENRKLNVENNLNLSSIFNYLHLSSIIYCLLSGLFFLTLLYTRSRSGLLAFAFIDLFFWGMLFLRAFHVREQFRERPIESPSIKRLLDRLKRHIATKSDTIAVSFVIIHIFFAGIFFFTGSHIETIDAWVTYRGVKTQISSAGWWIKSQNNVSNIENTVATTSTERVTPTKEKTVGPMLETGGTESGVIRTYVWQGAINAWKSSVKTILIGTGVETFAFAFYEFKPIGHNLTSEWDFLYNKAHNEYLNYLATSGIIGATTYLILLFSFIVWSIKCLIFNLKLLIHGQKSNIQSSNMGSMESTFIELGLFFGWLSILITNFFGFSVVIVQLLLFLLPAIIITLERRNTGATTHHDIKINLDGDQKHRTILSFVICFLSSILLFSLFLMWKADTQYALGYHLSRSGYSSTAYTHLSKAIRNNPFEPVYHDEYGTVLATLAVGAFEQGEATLSGELAKISIQENDKALKTSPSNVSFWKSRTKIIFALSGIDQMYLPEAINALVKAQTLSPNDPKIAYNLSILYGKTGQLEKSIESLQRAIAMKPNYRDAYYALAIFYRETGNSEASFQTANEYLTNIDPNDETIKTLLQ